MHDILLQVEHLITKVSDAIWPVFLPFILVVGAINGCQVDCYNTEKGYRASKIKI